NRFKHVSYVNRINCSNSCEFEKLPPKAARGGGPGGLGELASCPFILSITPFQEYGCTVRINWPSPYANWPVATSPGTRGVGKWCLPPRGLVALQPRRLLFRLRRFRQLQQLFVILDAVRLDLRHRHRFLDGLEHARVERLGRGVPMVDVGADDLLVVEE